MTPDPKENPDRVIKDKKDVEELLQDLGLLDVPVFEMPEVAEEDDEE